VKPTVNEQKMRDNCWHVRWMIYACGVLSFVWNQSRKSLQGYEEKIWGGGEGTRRNATHF